MRDPIFSFALVSFLILSSLAFHGSDAQEISAYQSETEREPNLIGYVFDGISGEPLYSKILVHGDAVSSFRLEFETGRDGIFKASVPSGEVYVLVEAEGYDPVRERVKIPVDEVRKIEIPMKPVQENTEPNLFGMILADEGKGVMGMITFNSGPENSAMRVKSDENGKFELFLHPGSYVWTAEAKGFRSLRGEVEVPEKESVSLEILMEPVSQERNRGTLIGKVLDQDGDPLPFTEIVLFHLYEDAAVCCSEEKWVETDEEGSLKIDLPLGAYHLEAYHDGFFPFELDFRLTSEDPVMEIRIMMEEEEEPENIRIHMEYYDRNSDGFPEKLLIEADVDRDDEPEVVIEMKDNNSDGNPESVIFDIDLPEDQMTEILFLVLEKANQMPPFRGEMLQPGHDWEPDDEDGPDLNDEDLSGKELYTDGRTETADRDDDGNILPADEGKNLKGADSSNNDSGIDQLPFMAASILALIAVLSLVVVGGYVLRFRKMN